MARLKTGIVPPGEARSNVGHLLQARHASPLVINAGAHSIRYDYQTDIRFGAALYKATILGPNGRAITQALGAYPFTAATSPYHQALGWYTFVQWHGDINGSGSAVIKIVNLSTGEVLSERPMRGRFVGWRGGISTEYVALEYEEYRYRWLAYDAVTGKARELFLAGDDGYVSEDGRYLLVLKTTRPVFVALVSIDAARALDVKEDRDFHEYVHEVRGIEVVSFDPAAPSLAGILNRTKYDPRTGEVVFEEMITIEVHD